MIRSHKTASSAMWQIPGGTGASRRRGRGVRSRPRAGRIPSRRDVELPTSPIRARHVQLTFHEQHAKKIDAVDCIKVEPDIDYFMDGGAHTLFEVISNTITHGLTDPKQVYALRWIAARHVAVPEFAPPYTIAV